MHSLANEFNEIRRNPLVDTIYYTKKLEAIAVKLVIDPAIAGLEKRNVLYFPVGSFTSGEVTSRITKLLAESALQ